MDIDSRRSLSQSEEKNISFAVAMHCGLQCRKTLNPHGMCRRSCFTHCPSACKNVIMEGRTMMPQLPKTPATFSPPLPLQAPFIRAPPEYHSEKNEIVQAGLIAGAGLAGFALFFIVICFIFKACRSRHEGSWRRRMISTFFFGTREEFFNEVHGLENLHPIWYVNTVGLHQSVIDSITVFKYNKGENLVEGTECSVCLSEFREDETLKFLPKCSHAFHVQCIDTWLRRHKNCPLCRAPIVSDDYDAHISLSVPSTSGPSSIGESQSEDFENNSGLLSVNAMENRTREAINQDRDFCALPIEVESARETVRHSLVQSELASVTDKQMQPMRRSVSLGFHSTLSICNAVANAVIPDNHRVDSDARSEQRELEVERHC